MPPPDTTTAPDRCANCRSFVEQVGAARDENEQLRTENALAVAELGKVYQELDRREESHAKLHRRAQLAEAALVDARKLAAGVPGSGRTLLRYEAARLQHERAELMQLVEAAVIGFRDLGSGEGDVFATTFVLQAGRTLERMKRNGGGSA